MVQLPIASVDYIAGLNAIHLPLLVMVGSKDEAFVAEEFEIAVKNNSKGDIDVIREVSQSGIWLHLESKERI
ncbi:MAG: hypothetical protein ABIR66_01070 [Saprospiraceae bacterium]